MSDSPEPFEKPVFHLGLALTGSSTTHSAYTAGVIDFLIQALSEWEAEFTSITPTPTSQSSNEFSSIPAPHSPPWRVQLRTLVGSGGGALTAALATSTLCSPQRNSFHNLWVDSYTCHNLFSITDLDVSVARTQPRGPPVPIRSILHSGFLGREARVALRAPVERQFPPSWAEKLELYLPNTNLRGVPVGRGKEKKRVRSRRHADWIGFALMTENNRKSKYGLALLDLRASRVSKTWEKVRAAATAAATIPVLFPVKSVTTRVDVYEKRVEVMEEESRLDWPKKMDDKFKYDAVDSMLSNKRPLEMVRRAMQKGEKYAIFDEDPMLSRGAVVLVNPHVRAEEYEKKYSSVGGSVFTAIRGMIRALLSEANFGEDELEEMIDDENFSTFLICPNRQGRKRKQVSLGADALGGGFGGLLAKEIREHDFQLGRYNCQRFLLDEFVITPKVAQYNPIFGGEAIRFSRKVSGSSKEVIPIIPLVGSAKVRCAEPKWPVYGKQKQDHIRSSTCRTIRKRVYALLSSFAYNLGFYREGFSFGINSTWNYVVDSLLNMTTDRIMAFVHRHIARALRHFSP